MPNIKIRMETQCPIPLSFSWLVTRKLYLSLHIYHLHTRKGWMNRGSRPTVCLPAGCFLTTTLPPLPSFVIVFYLSFHISRCVLDLLLVLRKWPHNLQPDPTCRDVSCVAFGALLAGRQLKQLNLMYFLRFFFNFFLRRISFPSSLSPSSFFVYFVVPVVHSTFFHHHFPFISIL
jgi:hypothetical protein